MFEVLCRVGLIILVIAVVVVWWPWRWSRREEHGDLAAARHALLWLWANSYLYEVPPVEISLAVKAAQVARGKGNG